QARCLGLETITGLVEAFDFGSRRFDVVTICQTVDHLLDIGGTPTRARDILSGHGGPVIDIPDFPAALLPHPSVEEAIKIDHPYYLTDPTMVAYLKRSGFEVLRSDYAADHLHVSYMCRPGAARPTALPSKSSVDDLLREVRFVQNTRSSNPKP